MISAAPSREVAAPAGAVARLERLCDAGTVRPIRSAVLPRDGGGREGAAGDGVVAGLGEVAGRPIACYSQDPSFMGGSLGSVHAETICRLLELAGRSGVPVVGFVESGGARLQEGHDALTGYGRIFRASVELSARVPQISVVTGVSAGGGAYSPALTDFVVMSEAARMFLTGPRVVGEAMGEWVSMEELGGPGVHSRNGVCQLVAADEDAATDAARRLLGYLPSRIGGRAPTLPSRDPVSGDPGDVVPADPRRVYDVVELVERICDAGSVTELGGRWGASMSCSLARIEGRPVGVIANQPRRIGGVIDAAAAEKGAGFVDLCDRFGLPLVVLVDTPGFMPGTRQEGAGVIRHGASLLRAFAGARVPKVTVVTRKAYGGAVITMNSKGLGADLAFAWPGAEIGIMAAGQAVGVVHRRHLAEAGEGSEELRARLCEQYAGEHLTAEAAATSGFVDAIVEPGDTRLCLAQALATIGGDGG